MSISFGPKLGLLYNAFIGETYTDQFRTFLQSLDAVIQASVINFTQPVPPSSPSAGDAYFVQISPPPSGAWAGQGGRIAIWDAQLTQSGTNNLIPGWIFVTPLPGWVVWNTSLNGLFVYTGSTWNNITTVVPPIAPYSDYIASSGSISPIANQATIWSLPVYNQITGETISYSVATADNSSNRYDIGIYDVNGNLLASTGSLAGTTFCPSTGYQNQTLIGQTVFPVGIYYVAITGNAATLALNTTLSTFAQTQAANAGSTTGGTLSATISDPITTWEIGARPAISIH